MRIATGLLLGAAIAFAVACGAAKSGGSQPTTTAGSPGGADASIRRTELDELSAKIDADLAKLQIPRPPSVPGVEPTPLSTNIVKPSADPTCKRSEATTCKESCDLGDSICGAAKRICEIAGELGNDTYANEKCASGKASCDAARERCCNCT